MRRQVLIKSNLYFICFIINSNIKINKSIINNIWTIIGRILTLKDASKEDFYRCSKDFRDSYRIHWLSDQF
jgi:hypothetical protein